jgi:hypothetical protein
MSPAADEDLLARQSALQQQAREVLAGLDLAALVADTGSLLVTGSFVSGPSKSERSLTRGYPRRGMLAGGWHRRQPRHIRLVLRTR